MDDATSKQRPCRIIVTQPRRLSAISLAERVADERQEPVRRVCQSTTRVVGKNVTFFRVLKNNPKTLQRYELTHMWTL